MRPRKGLALLLAAGALAAARPCRAGRDGGVAGFRPGEGFTYTFSVGAIQAGHARLSVGLLTRSKRQRLVAVSGDAQSARWLAPIAPLDDIYQVTIDAETLRSLTVSTVEHGIRERKVEARIEGPRLKVDLENHDEKRPEFRSLHGFLDGRAVDPVAALFALRALPLADGETLTLLVFDGAALYRATAKVIAHERIELPPIVAESVAAEGRRRNSSGDGQRVAAIRVDVDAPRADAWAKIQQPRRLTIWLSDDGRRIPYRMQADTDLGRCTLDIAGYRDPPGGGSALRTARAPTRR